ncbi:Retrovirus-related Pol polyprotein from transposon RE1 [Vitis vinifera]|uniref:Retrovirus-related Pol polyprotein from transposon RE1 n=1 Tax=Vitis vinifera TaxID=29760 RepID=A0A438DEH0_VITVI|nr:Retrovirus-related Pol polyprotein from transposon RE1 [Vitis vinifera]
MPETTEPGFRKWKIENSMIMSWLINSMNNDIGRNFLLFGTAKDIWDAAKETYSSSEILQNCFRFESALHDFRQGEHNIQANCGTKETVQVLPRTKQELDDVRGRIMGIKPLPSLRELFQSTTGVAFTANRGGMRPWIVDTGASDHMTGDAAILQITSQIMVIHPSILLMVQRLEIGEMIGSAELCSGLYLLSCGQFSNQVSQASCVQSQSMSESFNSVSNSKGESMNEHQVWESFLDGVPSFHSESPNPSQFAPTELSTPMPPSVQPAQHTNVPSPVTIQSPMPIQPIAPQLANENLQDGEVLIPSIDDSTLPIALRKGVRRCTDHPIGNYVTYEGLSPSYRAFATSLDDTQRPVGCKWIFTIKYKADGSVERFKARLVARGFTQSYGIDYQETFAPVAKLNTIRILLSLAVNQDWCLQQLDIKNAFLNGDLEEEVYMEIPPGFEESMAKNQVCKLQKSLYGLKQSPRAWFDRFTKAVLKLGYKQGQADHTLFVKKSHAGKLAILIVYVDDIILSGNDMGELQNLKKYLSEEFEVKDLGNLKYFLGMEVARSRKGIVVSQRKYILDLLKETGMLGCKPIDTPMDSQKKLGIEKEMSAVSQFMHSPTEEHMEAVYRILRYLKMTPGKGLFFRKTENRDTEVYSDADGQETSLTGGPLPDIVLLSGEILLPGGAAISIAKNPVHHDRTKHVEIDRHFITEKVTSETVKLNYVPTKHQTADILTKALPRPNFEDLTCKLGLYDIYSPA